MQRIAITLRTQWLGALGILIGLTGVALAGLPLLRRATGGTDWPDALAGGLAAVVALDIAFAIAGIACFAAVWWQSRLATSRPA